MRIPSDCISKFQKLYKQAFGVDISAEEAQIQGLACMRLVAIREEQKLLERKDHTLHNLIPQKTPKED